MGRSFVVFVDSDQNPVAINLDQVRRAFRSADGAIQLDFDSRDSVTIHGEGAVQMWNRILERALTLAGQPFDPEPKP